MAIKTLSVDISKSTFHTLGFNKTKQQVHKAKFTRRKFIEFLTKLPSATVVLEACATAHQWARDLQAMGHKPVLIAPGRVKRFVETGAKNDFNDAMGIFEAFSMPNTHHVAIKSRAQQSLVSIHRLRERLVRDRVQLLNQMRAILSEQSYIAPQGRYALLKMAREAFEEVDEYTRIPLSIMFDELEEKDRHIATTQKKLESIATTHPIALKLMKVPGIGPIIATALLCEVGDFHIFKSGRQFSAWLGIVPKQFSTGGKDLLGRITKAGNQYLRRLLVQGAKSLYRTIKNNQAQHKPLKWMQKLIQKDKPGNKVCVAMANKIARIAWAMIVHDREYEEQFVSLPPSQYQKVNP